MILDPEGDLLMLLNWSSNCLKDDTSMKIGMSSLHWSLDKKTVWATWNFKKAAIFQDGRHLSGAVKWCSGLFGDIQAWKFAWAVSDGH